MSESQGRIGVVANYVRPDGLPRYTNPPVTEVSMGFQFQGLPLRAVDLGRLHEVFAAEYPEIEERPAMISQVEAFDAVPQQMVQFQFFDKPPIPMVVFLDREHGRLIQVQGDRFHCSWRKVGPADLYPDYRDLRERFVQNAVAFEDFSGTLGVTDIPVMQAEIGYVNDIRLGVAPEPGAVSNVLSILNPPDDAAILPEPEYTRVQQAFTFMSVEGVPSARLHVAADPIHRDSSVDLRLSLTYRGEPHERFPSAPSMLSAMMMFFDEGHHQIVRAFTAVTTEKMHEAWGRQHDR